MTIPRIEEMVEEAIKIITRPPFAVTENAFFYAVTPERLEEVVTQAHQAGIDEATVDSVKHTKSNEEIVEELLGYAIDYAEERHVALLEQDKSEREKLLTSAADEFSTDVFHLVVKPALTEAHQAGIDEAVEIVKQFIEDIPEAFGWGDKDSEADRGYQICSRNVKAEGKRLIKALLDKDNT